MIHSGQIYKISTENIREIAEKIQKKLANKKFSFSSVVVRNGKLIENHLSYSLTYAEVGYKLLPRCTYITLNVNGGCFFLNEGLNISFQMV